ncbi:hypothetical protein [Streptomyces sp. HB132]|uniref:hypothetical protein n=1 Tax=Streptomyces sp. HB132 TaxID=767388 RepID=UPI001961DAB7|nr:hypothetical protein [Streptomyces sp. HB132]MBM7439032.1 hypothetical protein [Streptomyces sp. HB132]
MGDMYALDLALNLRATTPGAVVDELGRHLGVATGTGAGLPEGTAGVETGEPTEPADVFPLLAERGPAARIGGLLVGELHRTAHGWALTARQEVHAESLPDLDPLLARLAQHSSSEGVIGQIRFYEDHVPDLLISEAGTLFRMSLKPDGSGAARAYPPL